VPREVALRTIDGRTELVQEPIRELRALREGRAHHLTRRTLTEGAHELDAPRATGKALDIVADFDIKTAARFGLRVRTGDDEETEIGYDAAAGELYVDRTRSGDVGFNRDFPGVQRAPLPDQQGRVHLRILVDWSSVEVFGDDGRPVITDQIFPGDTSEGVELFSAGGDATLDSLTIWPMASIWPRAARAGD
jgi:fructan beta-fructosidase